MQNILQEKFQKIANELDKHLSQLPKQELEGINSQSLIDISSSDKISKQIAEEIFDLGPIKQLVFASDITEIMIQSHDSIWVEKNSIIIRTNIRFLNNKSYENLIHRICSCRNIYFDKELPFQSFKWNNFRIHLIADPITDNIKTSLRRISSSINLGKIIDQWPKDLTLYLKNLVKQKNSFLVIGTTGSGKTTLLNTLLSWTEFNERSVIIEDTDEIIKPNELSIKLLTKNKIADQSELIKQALRMRPDRIIMGEIRSCEAKDYLLALSTGHAGSMCTLHADDPQQALYRLEMLVQMGSPQWSLDTVRRLVKLSLNYIIHVKNYANSRKVHGIYKLSSLEDTGFTVEKVW